MVNVLRPMTIAQLAEYYAGTGLTRTAIRRAILNEEVPSVRAGKKYLSTLEAVENWLQKGSGSAGVNEATATGIRRIDERR